jgi:ketol-acid reductoisomerase
VDYSTLSRLGVEGLAAVSGEQLTTLADWCQDWAEATGDARYCFIAKTLSAVDAWREHHDEAGGVPAELLLAIDALVRAELPAALAADTPSHGAHLAADLCRSVLPILQPPAR